MGKAHGQIDRRNPVNADEAGAAHRLGKPIALPAAWGAAGKVGAVLPQIFPADGFVAALSLGAAKPAALVAQKFHLAFLGGGQGGQLGKVIVQAKIRHHIAKFLPVQLRLQLPEIGKHLGGGGDEVEPGVLGLQIVQQQIRVDDYAVLRAVLGVEQGAEPVAAPVRKMLRFQQGIAEGQPGRDAVFPGQGQCLLGRAVAEAHSAPAPDAVRRGAIDGADAAPVVKIFRVLPEKRQKDPVKIQKFKQPGKMKIGNVLLGCPHRANTPSSVNFPIIAGRTHRIPPKAEPGGKLRLTNEKGTALCRAVP